MDLRKRLTAVETALRLQLAAGTSHLQEIEMAPSAFGLSADARPAIKAIRKRRNAALHVVEMPKRYGDGFRRGAVAKLVSEWDGKTVHEVSATGKEQLKSYGGGVGRGTAGHLGRGKGIDTSASFEIPLNGMSSPRFNQPSSGPTRH